MLPGLLKTLWSSVGSGWSLGLSVALCLACVGWWLDRSSLDHDMHLLLDRLEAQTRRGDALEATLEASQAGLAALRARLAEADQALADSRRAERDRRDILKKAGTRRAKKGEVLDDETSGRVLAHIRGSFERVRQ